MIAPLILAFFSLSIFFIFSSNKWKTTGLMLSFFLVFIFLAFRFDYGNDYLDYLNMFKEIKAAGAVVYNANEWHAEVGWFYLNRLFSDVGFFSMIIVLAVFNCCIYYRFISNFVPSRYWWLAIFLYVIVPDNMLIQASAMRQSVAISFFLLGIEFIIRRDWLKYSICVCFAMLFHSSALILLPVYIIGSPRIVIQRKIIPLLIGIYIGLFFLGNILKEIIFSAVAILSRDYSMYDEVGNSGSGFGLVFYGFYLSILLLYHDQQKFANRVLFRIVIISLYLLPLAVSVAMLARIISFFSVVSIAVIPLVAAQIKSKNVRVAFILLEMTYAIYGYFQIVQGSIFREKFADYKTIFSSAIDFFN